MEASSPADISTGGQMLRLPGQGSLREAIAFGFVAACFMLFSGCETSTSPSRSRAPGASPSLSRDAAPAHGVIVRGTGDPSVDVPAVQAAVDQGGEVILAGHFSFDAPATKPVPNLNVPAQGIFVPQAAEVVIAKAVTISGTEGEQAGVTTIDGGTIPFFINAPGQSVTIRGLRFVRPTFVAISAYAVTGLEIRSTRIEGVVPFAHLTNGIAVATGGGVPDPSIPANPQLISGSVRIEGNDIDMAGATSGADNTLGIVLFNVGVAGAEVDARVAGNRIRNANEPAVDMRQIVGQGSIEYNDIITSSDFGSNPRNQAVRVVNTGRYRVAHNSITCRWGGGFVEGIGVFSKFAVWPVTDAVIVDNDIDMTPPAGTVFTDFSAAIGVYGYAQNTVVRDNRIHGSARAGVSIPSVFPLPPLAPATPQDNAFINNQFVNFTPSDADVFVGSHAFATRIVGQGTVDDQGSGTVIGPTAAARWNAIAGAQTLTHALSQQLGSRIFAYLSLAQYNAAVAAQTSKHEEQRPSVPAAVAAASAAVLGSFYPDQTASFDALLADQESQSQGGQRHSDFAAGAAIGRDAAAAVMARAATDGFTSSADGVVMPVCAGCWTTAPGQIPVFPRLNEMKTFFLKSASQFRPGPPPTFGSPAFLTDLAEVRSISDNRTHLQDSIAKFWAKPGGFTVAASYANVLATREIEKFHLNELGAAHVLAVMNMAAMDAFIASHDAKYTYWMIRPSQTDPGIVPDIPLPNHPSYPSNHASVTGCAMTVLAAFFPSDANYLDGLADQAAISRIYGGIHYRFDMVAGLALGRTVARYALEEDAER
jgi:membrane-associated phospholipid phosphatase